MNRFKGRTVGSALALAARILSGIDGIPTPGLDARVLLIEAAARGGPPLDNTRLFTRRDIPLTDETASAYDGYIRRREALESVQYIVNSCEFMGLPFYVDADVLIPRPETEILVEKAFSLMNERGYRRVLDMCTGSGCIAVAVARYCGAARVTAADISGPALAIARRNAYESGARGIEFLQSDLFAGLPADKFFDILLCNPPYISKSEMAELGRNVRYEPEGALFGGEDGLDFYRRIAGEIRRYVRPGGALLLEIGAAQGQSVASMFGGGEILKDYARLDRVFYKTL